MSDSENNSVNFAAALVERTRVYGRFVRFSHTVFALPFALAGWAMAVREHGFSWWILLWIAVAMVAARSASMGFNRIVDRRYDTLNPRTAGRELPRGKLTVGAAWIFVAVSSIIFLVAAWVLNPLCGWLSPVALAITFFYSISKRFTWTSQFWLGLSLAVAPVGAWLAVTAAFDWRILPLTAAVLFWVAGFDIFYSCLDLEFDKEHGLHSVPRRWGLGGAIWTARLLHALTAVLLISQFWIFELGIIYLAGTALVVCILAVEDFMVRPDDLSRVRTAFNLNGWVSVIFLISIIAGLF